MTQNVETNEKRYRAPALDKGLDILELLSAEPSGLTRAEIVRSMDKSASEIYRMLERLVMRGYVTRSPEGDRYCLSLKLFCLATVYPPLQRLRSIAQPLMDSFAIETLQSVHLAALERDTAIVIAQASGPAHWEFRLRLGSQLDLFNTSSGATLLAFQDDVTLTDMLSHARDSGALSSQKQVSEKQTEIAKIKKDGQRTSDSKQLIGVTDISVPVLDPQKNSIAVLTCPYIKRVSENAISKKHPSVVQTRNALLRLAAEISVK